MTSIYLESEYVPVNCGSDGCDQRFAMSRQFYDETKRTGRTWYCPSGHPRVWRGETTEQKLRASEAQKRHLEDQLRASIADGETTRQALLRDRHRFANGVCPCCNRSFTNVARHMASQHPDYDASLVRGDTAHFECSCGDTFETLRGLRTHQGRLRRTDWNDPDAFPWRAHLSVV